MPPRVGIQECALPLFNSFPSPPSARSNGTVCRLLKTYSNECALDRESDILLSYLSPLTFVILLCDFTSAISTTKLLDDPWSAIVGVKDCEVVQANRLLSSPYGLDPPTPDFIPRPSETHAIVGRSGHQNPVEHIAVYHGDQAAVEASDAADVDREGYFLPNAFDGKAKQSKLHYTTSRKILRRPICSFRLFQ